MTLKILLLILVFSMVLRSILFLSITAYWPSAAYYADHLCSSIMFIAMAAASFHQFKIDRDKLSFIVGGKITIYQVALSATIAILLLMLTFGESAIFTKTVAQYDIEAAYRLGKFHVEAYNSHPFFSLHVFTFIICSVIFPAIFEELFFRGLVFRSINKNKSFFLSAVLTSAIFTAIHFSKTLFIGTFLFSLALSYLYAITGSLRTCMITHATFNLLAFISQYYFDFHRIRSINELNEWHHWIPELSLLAVALIAFGWMTYISKDAIKQASLPALPPVEHSDERQRPAHRYSS
ncbi:CPBP family intramembrane glutamic endopeptidase [Massilia pseudoviolaceinigra]|uniref:CPBP family intramembrane glutamic endopeptidase n=1 Tax=Massilia pseudoviolaceinigra TaxID=3057165 RepID=UPI0027965F28|nr:CPBP family intramembrane glutamic endopeptidase [Massilia sp. CCM 9206]MDQ1923823.1 CPBP family intramembrane metalloprotease [Massilia sp. CCM 9206]